MDTYSNLKDEVLQINRDLAMLFSTAKSIPGMADYSFGDWEKACDHLPEQLAEDIIRVAIVGPIKSGKSTFLNSIYKGEFVKRGAGVITSIVTRVRNGKRLRAKLFFKSWAEINAEMEAALVLFPSAGWRSEKSRFDLRRAKERRELAQALAELSSDQLITRSTRNINNVLLSSYIKGYDTVKSLLNAPDAVHVYEGDQFADHKPFVGNESLAVYLKDILLEIDSSHVRADVEIADCQGSDSSNPLHLAMIQDYLLLTHQMVYVISSRTGLRRADIRFLSMIKKMGILDNILFVINCDFSEHESTEDLNNLVDRIREELSMLKPDPQIYTFSALFNLFSANADALSDKEQLRMKHWQADEAFVELSNRETDRFETVFYSDLARKRNALLLQNHIERLGVILTGFGDWIALNRDILAKDADSVAETVKKIKKHQVKLNKIKTTINKTLSGAQPEIKTTLQQEVHRFFDQQAGSVNESILNFIDGYGLSPHKYSQSLDDTDFTQILLLVFQDFKQAIDTYIAESINPELIRFIQFNQKQIEEYFSSLILPFDALMEEAFEEFNGLSDSFDAIAERSSDRQIRPPQMADIIKTNGLRPPTLIGATHYSARIKAEAIMRLGYYKAVRKSKSVFKKSNKRPGEIRIKVLDEALRRMKRETAKSIAFHLKDFRENLKFSYFFKLVEAVSASFGQTVLQHFQAYFSDLSATIERIGTRRSDKEKAKRILEELEQASKEMMAKIDGIRTEIQNSS